MIKIVEDKFFNVFLFFARLNYLDWNYIIAKLMVFVYRIRMNQFQ
jgi:hypothetical protein